MHTQVLEQPTVTNQVINDHYALYNGDCVEVLKQIPDSSVGLTVTSPPFPKMYVYNDLPNDIGNSRDTEELMAHLGFLMPELYRVTMPGRLVILHCTQVPVFKKDAGYCGLEDFRGELIRCGQRHGFIYFGDVSIEKNASAVASRTKEQSLLFKTLSEDSTNCRPVMGDYLVILKKPGANFDPVRAGANPKYNPSGGWITDKEWCEWARNVWLANDTQVGGIRQTDTLNVAIARDANDERHLCPLALCVIERCIKLWSNPGDVVLDPFNGVGSTGYKAIELKRKYLGVELKKSYFDTAVKYLESRIDSLGQLSIFDLLSVE